MFEMVLHDIISCVTSAGVAPSVLLLTPRCCSADWMATLSFNLPSRPLPATANGDAVPAEWRPSVSSALSSLPDHRKRQRWKVRVHWSRPHTSGPPRWIVSWSHSSQTYEPFVCVCCCLWSMFAPGANINTRSEVNLILTRCSSSTSGCWCTWNSAVNFRQRG